MQKRLNGEALEEYVKPIGGDISLLCRALKLQTIIWDSLCSKHDDDAPQYSGVFPDILMKEQTIFMIGMRLK